LRQWRSYGSNATGVSIAIGTADFQQVSGPDMPSDLGLMYLWRVFYDVAKQSSIVRDCVIVAHAQAHLAAEARAELAIEALRFFSPTFKNPAFEDEHEARLVFRPVPNCRVRPCFRVNRGMLVPYYSMKELAASFGVPSWRPPIASVRIGPNPNRDINQEGVRLMLKSFGYPDACVDVSDAPYRG
jgi:hypothetical protein